MSCICQSLRSSLITGKRKVVLDLHRAEFATILGDLARLRWSGFDPMHGHACMWDAAQP